MPHNPMQSKEGYERAVAELDATNSKLDLQVANCRYCRMAKRRAEALGVNLQQRPSRGNCKRHREAYRLAYVTSPVSEAYWTS